jgi:hypothetical protein
MVDRIGNQNSKWFRNHFEMWELHLGILIFLANLITTETLGAHKIKD